MQLGRAREVRDLLAVPVRKDLAGGCEDVGAALPASEMGDQISNHSRSRCRRMEMRGNMNDMVARKRGRTLSSQQVVSATMVKSSGGDVNSST